MASRMTGAQLLESGQRFSVAMWEYSWLVQRSGRQSEYADWDKVLDELKERGYDCIRIDAFPHCIASGPDGKTADDITFLPIANNFMWGNHEPVSVNPRAGLIGFMKKIKERGLYVGLSCWYNDDAQHRKLVIHSPQDYSRIWLETLDVLDAEGLLDIVVWVDICNEFPVPSWCPVPCREITGKDPDKFFTSMLKLAGNWGKQGIQRAGEYYTQAIQGVMAKYPNLKYTFSCQYYGEKNVQKADTSSFDLAEPHIWTVDDLIWGCRSSFFGTLRGKFPEEVLKHSRKASQLFPRHKDKMYAILERRMDCWSEWAKKRNLPLVTTEGWSTVMYEDMTHCGFGGEWDWFKETAEMAVELAIKKGWQGICTSNFCEPHFEGMWYDIAWHKRMTDMIRQP
jgi:hypothetical protein